MVTISANAARPRACSALELKNRVPASAMTTNASPMALAMDSSSRLDRPVRPAPEAVVMRCTNRPVPFTAAAPALAAPDAADAPVLAACWEAAKSRLARLGSSLVPVSPMAPVFCFYSLDNTAEPLPACRSAASPGVHAVR